MGLYKKDKLENELNIGDKVRTKEGKQEGFITGKDGDLYIVLMNDTMMIDMYEAEELEN